jgi:hypothetical protein
MTSSDQVRVAHPVAGTAQIPVSALPSLRQRGWTLEGDHVASEEVDHESEQVPSADAAEVESFELTFGFDVEDDLDATTPTSISFSSQED